MIRAYALSLMVSCILHMYFVQPSPSMIGRLLSNNILDRNAWTLVGYLILIIAMFRLFFEKYGSLFNFLNRMHGQLLEEIELIPNQKKKCASYIALGLFEGIAIYYVVAGFFFLGAKLNLNILENTNMNISEIINNCSIPFVIYLICLIYLYFIPKDEDRKIFIVDCSKPFETFFLLKTTRFKNYPSGKLYFIKAIGNSAMFVFVSVVVLELYVMKFLYRTGFQIEIDPITISGSIMVLVIAFYWNERSGYINKWEYLANLYNKMIESTSIKQYEMYHSSLVQDIYLTEMWGHKTYYKIMTKAIADAIGKTEEECNFRLTDASVVDLIDADHKKKTDKFKEALTK